MNGYPVNGGRQASGPSEQASGWPAYKGDLDESLLSEIAPSFQVGQASDMHKGGADEPERDRYCRARPMMRGCEVLYTREGMGLLMGYNGSSLFLVRVGQQFSVSERRAPKPVSIQKWNLPERRSRKSVISSSLRTITLSEVYF